MRAKDTLGLSQILSHTKHEMRLQMDEALAKLGLTSSQYAALSSLEESGPLTNADLARAGYVTPQTMIRLMKSLEKQGFVVSNQHAEHGLKIEFELTKKALDVLCKAHVLIYGIERRMIGGLSDNQTRQLLQHLNAAFSNLQKKPTTR